MSEARRKALSIRQPWAWAIIHAGKDVENRSEAAVKVMAGAVGQRIFIHAARTFSRAAFEENCDFLKSLGIEPPGRNSLDFGGVIGSAKIAGIVAKSASSWFFRPCGLHLVEARPLPFFEVRGQLNLFYVTAPPGIAP